MLKNTIMFAVVAGLVFALSPTAGAQTSITVLNHSFESPDIAGGTTGNNPDNWTCNEPNGGDTIIHEARVAVAGPTHGDQIMYFAGQHGVVRTPPMRTRTSVRVRQ